jgi:hypothetical protein
MNNAYSSATGLDGLHLLPPQPLSLRNLSQLKASFEDSDIPICIDLVDWQQADPSFKSAVTAQGMVVLQTSQSPKLIANY